MMKSFCQVKETTVALVEAPWRLNLSLSLKALQEVPVVQEAWMTAPVMTNLITRTVIVTLLEGSEVDEDQRVADVP